MWDRKRPREALKEFRSNRLKCSETSFSQTTARSIHSSALVCVCVAASRCPKMHLHQPPSPTLCPGRSPLQASTRQKDLAQSGINPGFNTRFQPPSTSGFKGQRDGKMRSGNLGIMRKMRHGTNSATSVASSIQNFGRKTGKPSIDRGPFTCKIS